MLNKTHDTFLVNKYGLGCNHMKRVIFHIFSVNDETFCVGLHEYVHMHPVRK
jgi:hypothetical protein